MTHPVSKDELRAPSVTIPGRTRYQQYIHETAKHRFGGLPGFLYHIGRGNYKLASGVLDSHRKSTEISWLDGRIAAAWLKNHLSYYN